MVNALTTLTVSASLNWSYLHFAIVYTIFRIIYACYILSALLIHVLYSTVCKYNLYVVSFAHF